MNVWLSYNDKEGKCEQKNNKHIGGLEKKSKRNTNGFLCSVCCIYS